jgi:hypothetical protein
VNSIGATVEHLNTDLYRKRLNHLKITRSVTMFLAVLVAVATLACSGGGNEYLTAASTSTPQPSVALTTAPAPTPVPDTSPDESGTGSLQVRVTDAPGDATAVLVTVSSVQVNVQGADDNADSWITVVEGPRTFDLVALDGVEAILGESELAEGSYGQIRLEVGEVEIVTPDGTLTAIVPSGTLKLVGG